MTVKATIYETAVCLAYSGPTCVKADFYATGGTYEIFYDDSPDADRLLGSGYLDGQLLIAGGIYSGYAGQFQVTGAGSGNGNFNFKGSVTFTETDNTKDAWINPALASSIAGAEIKLGGDATDWTAPSDWIDGGGIQQNSLVLQADGNQSFKLPEPGTLALLGLGMIGFVAGSRRRAA